MGDDAAGVHWGVKGGCWEELSEDSLCIVCGDQLGDGNVILQAHPSSSSLTQIDALLVSVGISRQSFACRIINIRVLLHGDAVQQRYSKLTRRAAAGGGGGEGACAASSESKSDAG